MNASPSLLGARTRLFFAGVLVLVGSLPVLYLLALLGWQVAGIFLWGTWVPLSAALLFLGEPAAAGKAAAVLPFIPHIPGVHVTNAAAAGILAKLHVAVIPALVGGAIVARAMLAILRQRARIRAARQRIEDRVRRIEDYRRGENFFDDRREPYLGSDNADDKPDRWAA
jgi:hypothetical protein